MSQYGGICLAATSGSTDKWRSCRVGGFTVIWAGRLPAASPLHVMQPWQVPACCRWIRSGHKVSLGRVRLLMADGQLMPYKPCGSGAHCKHATSNIRALWHSWQESRLAKGRGIHVETCRCWGSGFARLRAPAGWAGWAESRLPSQPSPGPYC